MTAINIPIIGQLTPTLTGILDSTTGIDWTCEAATTDLTSYLRSTRQGYLLAKRKINGYIDHIQFYANEWSRALKVRGTTDEEMQRYTQAIIEPTVDNASIAKVHKLTYLISSLQGEAARAVAGFAIQESNYNAIKDALFERNAHLGQIASMGVIGDLQRQAARRRLERRPTVCETTTDGESAGKYEMVTSGRATKIDWSRQGRGIQLRIHDDSATTTRTSEDDFATNQTLLPTTYADVINPYNPDQRYKAVVLFDCGSDSTYVTKELVQQLNLPIIGNKQLRLADLEKLQPNSRKPISSKFKWLETTGRLQFVR
ncbi:unnamed protein product [Anisakis simplex]|uniref:DUF1758 domain-containing protein n=1 Tax=Anisakis simplex TaxID=6269 RepID=A0A0M3K9Q3_ANISI|nr:unnamed protein product [Anisakis simplex]